MSATAAHRVGAGTVRIYDGLLPARLRSELYTRATESSFRIGWADTDAIEQRGHAHLHADWSQDDLNATGLLLSLAPTPLFAEFGGHRVDRAVLNLSTPSDVHFPHTHAARRVVLFYLNPEWQAHWYGETLFYDESLSRIELALPYTPGRVAVFEGTVPHALRPQSAQGPAFRFSLGLFLNPDQ